MNFISAMFHNSSLIKQGEDIINEFIKDKSCTVWIEDEEGNCFIPKGKVRVNYYQITELMSDK